MLQLDDIVQQMWAKICPLHALLAIVLLLVEK